MSAYGAPMSGRTARTLVLLLPLATSLPQEAHEPVLDVTPEAVALAGGALRLRLSPSPEDPRSIWIGLGFGRLVRLPTIAEPSDPPRRFCAQIPALDDVFLEPPRPGDHLLLVAYSGDRPLTGPRALPVIREIRRDIPCLPLWKGDAP